MIPNEEKSLANTEKHFSKCSNSCNQQNNEDQSSSVTDTYISPNVTKNSPPVKRKSTDPKHNIVYPSSVLSNVTQDVLLQLIEAGHLQVHTEEGEYSLYYYLR